MKNDRRPIGFNLARIYSALSGELDAETLFTQEREAFEELWGLAFELNPSPKLVLFMTDLQQKGGSFGYDATGKYVRGLPDGKVKIISLARSANFE